MKNNLYIVKTHLHKYNVFQNSTEKNITKPKTNRKWDEQNGHDNNGFQKWTEMKKSKWKTISGVNNMSKWDEQKYTFKDGSNEQNEKKKDMKIS